MPHKESHYSVLSFSEPKKCFLYHIMSCFDNLSENKPRKIKMICSKLSNELRLMSSFLTVHKIYLIGYKEDLMCSKQFRFQLTCWFYLLNVPWKKVSRFSSPVDNLLSPLVTSLGSRSLDQGRFLLNTCHVPGYAPSALLMTSQLILFEETLAVR